MDDGVDPNLDVTSKPQRKPPLPRAVRAGAALGLAAGWLAGLVIVFAASASISFAKGDTADGILIAAAVAGLALGAGAGWLLRNSESYLHFTAPYWTTLKPLKWGWRSGGIVGIFLAQSYMASHSPLGFYTESIVLVYWLIVPACAALGSGVALLLNTKDISGRGPSSAG